MFAVAPPLPIEVRPPTRARCTQLLASLRPSASESGQGSAMTYRGPRRASQLRALAPLQQFAA
eukprot:7246628-Alexandrium_andersonii.AAC.1